MRTDSDLDKTIVCLPTYNEAKNISSIIENILSVDPCMHILVIDDNSPDGTGSIVDELAKKNENISILHRSYKEGLGKAYIHGFCHVLSSSDFSVIIQMDSDFSHSPVHLKDMILKLNEADLVIGSRYITGGKIENWGVIRRVLSRFGSVYSRLWLKISVIDLTGGYKVWRRSLLESIVNNHHIKTSGYAFQIEMTYLAYLREAKIAEMPITFTERSGGRSKMTAGIAFEAFWRVPLIYWNEKKRRANR